MLNAHDMLFLVARDFVQLNSLQQRNIGIKLGLAGVGIFANSSDDEVAHMVFSLAYKNKKISELVRLMRPYLYE